MSKIRIVIVDKEKEFREGLKKLLENEPNIEIVATCHAGLAAVECVHKYKPEVVLIHGLREYCRAIERMQRTRKEQPDTKLIVIAHAEGSDHVISALRSGAQGYISRTNLCIDTLIKTITLVARGAIVIGSPIGVKLLANFNTIMVNNDRSSLTRLLSKREQEVMSLVSQGLTNMEIAATLVISNNTVKVHLRNIMDKLHAHTRQQAVNLIREENPWLGVNN